LLCRHNDALKHAFGVTKQLFISEPNYAITFGFDEPGPFRVLFNEFTVDWTVEFDDKGMLGAVEISDKRSNRILTSKLEAMKLPVSQNSPEHFLRLCFALTQIASGWNHRSAN
jgi:hypothetical protein